MTWIKQENSYDSLGRSDNIICAVVQKGITVDFENTIITDNSKEVFLRNCIIHSGAAIGTDGFGYCFADNGIVEKVEHFGGVEIGNEVEIGANACIDRGTIDNTIIGDNSKIDNLVHIAHNVNIGRVVCVVAGAVVCGSAKLHDSSYMAPGGIIKNQLEVGNNGFVGLGAVVTRSVKDNDVVTGIPAKPVRKVQTGDK